MHIEIAELARRHALPPHVVRDLESLWDRRLDATTLVEGYVPVELHTLAIDDDDGPLPTEETSEQELIGGRYVDLGPIGMGGMGEVRRVRDLAFNRTLAMKTLHTRLVDRPTAVARFLEEAQATGQLQHPGIVPIHDMGTHPDGRVWFVMKEVRGRTLTEVVREVHAASTERWVPGPTGFTFRRLVASFMQACHAVAYAHERGVVHRDLKPENVMIGAHGETMVLDWGLAKLVGRREHVFEEESTGELRLADLASLEGMLVPAGSGRHSTRIGTVAGTPAYMPPEQARGQVDRIDARTDVYALGAMLYEILSGRPPYEGTPNEILAQVLATPPTPVAGRWAGVTIGFGWSLGSTEPGLSGPPVPGELAAACERAMSREPSERFSSALALAAEVEAWLDGARRRDEALEAVERAEQMVAESDALVVRAATLRSESASLLADIAPWEPEARKAPGWDKAAQADAAELTAKLKQLEVDQTLLAALQISADLPEAHAALAERHLARHASAEAAREPLLQHEALLRTHGTALPELHPVRQRVATYLKGDGALTLVTDPPGAEVVLYRYVERNRRLVEVFERSLGTTPLVEVTLEMGSYVAVVQHPDRAEVRYPLEVMRHGHWDGVRPGSSEPHAVWLPPTGYLGPEDVYVPAGWFHSGGDTEAAGLPARRLWCDALVVGRFPVTNRAYLEFLHDLVAGGREEEALRSVPRADGGTTGPGPLLYGWDGRRFTLEVDAEGDVWLPDWPVINMDWDGARAYLEWLAAKTGHPWRLPSELEWEKAARGVDGRRYPWGDHLDPSWCRMFETLQGREHGDVGPAVVNSYPVDSSPCGVRGLGGNVQDWCLDLYDTPTAPVDDCVAPPDAASCGLARAIRVVRGGTWYTDARNSHSVIRHRFEPFRRNSSKGFRGVFRPAPAQFKPQ